MAVKSPEVQTAAKKAQLARIAAKGTPDYPALYASQPEQIRIGKAQRAERAKRREAKVTLQALLADEANQAVDVFTRAGSVDLEGAE